MSIRVMPSGNSFRPKLLWQNPNINSGASFSATTIALSGLCDDYDGILVIGVSDTAHIGNASFAKTNFLYPTVVGTKGCLYYWSDTTMYGTRKFEIQQNGIMFDRARYVNGASGYNGYDDTTSIPIAVYGIKKMPDINFNY